MTVSASFLRLRDEVKKGWKTKTFSSSITNAFITLLVAVWSLVKRIFLTTYNFIFVRLNKILPLPFVSTESTPVQVPKRKIRRVRNNNRLSS